MRVNKYEPHILVLPEDDANRQLARGFLLDPGLLTQKIQVLEEVGGWREVLNRFNIDHARGMDRFNQRYMILLIDFDDTPTRLNEAKASIPDHLTERVFVLGARTDPEALRQAKLGSYETIGLAMAQDCREDTNTIWDHDLLRHNAGEIERLREHVRPFLFRAID